MFRRTLDAKLRYGKRRALKRAVDFVLRGAHFVRRKRPQRGYPYQPITHSPGYDTET